MKMSVTVLNEQKTFNGSFNNVYSKIQTFYQFSNNLSILIFTTSSLGKSAHASWFLKNVLVHDLQTREKFYFFCQRWLAVERDDGQIDRVLPAAGLAQKREMRALASKNAKSKITDGHLWFSIMAKPAHSPFTRFERATACFTLMFISMFANILYYGVSATVKSEGLQIGPIKLTLEQVLIGARPFFMTPFSFGSVFLLASAGNIKFHINLKIS